MGIEFQVVFDCEDPDRMAAFWAEALGYVVQPPPEGFDTWEDAMRAWEVPESLWRRSAVVDPEGNGPRVFFQGVPEPKTVKNRVHLDLRVTEVGAEPEAIRERVDARAKELEQIGASTVRSYEELGNYWVVMRDPEGNEFCVT